MNLSELIKKNSILGDQLSEQEKVKIKILSNISVNQIKPTLEYNLRNNKLYGNVFFGDYDNIIQESGLIREDEIPIVFWELSNIKDSFVYEIETNDENFSNLYFDKVKSELEIIFQNLSTAKLVIFNKFSHILFSYSSIRQTNFEIFVNNLNDFLQNNLPANFIKIDIDKPISQISCIDSIDLRGLYLTKTLYTFKFLDCYARYITPIILSLYGKSKKALIFDCDNTLWKGIVGEDGINKIALSDKNKDGVYFKEIHLIAKRLSRNGVIIGLCSKNNLQDVEEVFEKREDFILKNNEIVIKKVNWENKAINLKKIAEELNIGTDSIVFLDDSKFEINFINEILPFVKTILVPERLFEYPTAILKLADLFFNLNISDEDKKRTAMYLENQLREKAQESFEDLDLYLKSLDIKITISNKDRNAFDRLVQLTQKTNQFNLTTKRYTTSDMSLFYDSNEYDVFSLDVSDKYGTSGVTGLCIVKYENKTAYIDTFLLSCRILGRNIEKVFLDEILKKVFSNQITNVISVYDKTQKNNQVENFYDQNNFVLLRQTENKKEYSIKLMKKNNNNIKYIKILWS